MFFAGNIISIINHQSNNQNIKHHPKTNIISHHHPIIIIPPSPIDHPAIMHHPSTTTHPPHPPWPRAGRAPPWALNGGSPAPSRGAPRRAAASPPRRRRRPCGVMDGQCEKSWKMTDWWMMETWKWKNPWNRLESPEITWNHLKSRYDSWFMVDMCYLRCDIVWKNDMSMDVNSLMI